MPLFPYKSAPLDFIVIVLIVELWQLVTTHLCMLASECQRIFLWACHQRFTLWETETRHEVSAHHCVLWWCHASELRLRSAFIPDVLFPNKSVRHPLMITTHHRHSVSPSWSTLFSPPIPLEDYSRVPPASPCMVIKHEPYWQGEHQTLFFLGLFTRRQKEEKNRITKLLYPRVKSICLFE